MGRSCLGFVIIFFLTLISCEENESDQILLSPKPETNLDKICWEIGIPEHGDSYYFNSDSNGILKISSVSVVGERLFKKIDIDPYARYRITVRIKTINVKGEGPKSGAGIRLERIPFDNDTTFVGDNDWTSL